MKTIIATNLCDAVAKCLPYMLENAISEPSRNGPVLVAPGPVCTVYQKPKQHVLYGEARDANPFFHVMEALWMLSGRNDVAFLKKFNSKIGAYSDDGDTLWGAYGHRWREHFGYDQLDMIIQELESNPTSRRCVLSMWNGMEVNQEVQSDLYKACRGGKDVPCNTHIYFDCRNEVVNMTVCNRSNDAIWGAYGANVVHMSFLLEYVAEQLARPMGVYRQFSNNFHIYTANYNPAAVKSMAEDAAALDLYKKYPNMPVIPLRSYLPDWHQRLERFLDTGEVDPVREVDDFLTSVAEPYYRAWHLRKNGEWDECLKVLQEEMPHSDWQVAALDWVDRHNAAARLKTKSKEKSNVA